MQRTAIKPNGTKAASEAAIASVALRRHPFITALAKELARCGVPLGPAASTNPARVVVGVSGGGDSSALLIGCVGVTKRRSSSNLQPVAVHVHHHLRASADDDAQSVEQLCDRLGVPLHIEHVRPGDICGNVSANARRMRYHALRCVAEREHADFIAVAHHAEDQLETMIASLCRGSGIKGLAGMPIARTMARDSVVRLIRPLLSFRRQECEALCTCAGVAWRDDPSNGDARRSRVRLRRDVLPVLEELWPSASRRAAGTAEILQSASDALGRYLTDHFGDPTKTLWKRGDLKSQSRQMVSAILRRAAIQLSPKAADALSQRDSLEVADLILSGEKRPRLFKWPSGLQLSVSARQVSLRQGEEAP